MYFRFEFGFGRRPNEGAEEFEEYRDVSNGQIERSEITMGFQPNQEYYEEEEFKHGR